ncbi:MAG TPA: CDP-alcohol phosphatidyltransferase family protein [Myxococcota bacterium]|nr:CDP-alcohol phosphatidyltransferase family protein [Myxococcota bacterium]HOD07849.1 CDP-alcohol phosphatidyltransferase family protein [Myxococcota bacterium]
MGFAERYRGLRPGLAMGTDANNLDFWGIVYGRPTAFLLLLLVGDIRWLTPNILTHMSNLFLVAGSLAILLDSMPAFIAAAIMLNISLTFDCADGQMARYRKNGSTLGSYYDKASDYFGMMLMYCTMSWVVFQRTEHAWYFLLAICALGCNMMTGYTKWLVVAHGHKPQPASASMPVKGLKLVGRVALKIFEFREPDIFLWFAIALLIDRPELALILMGISQPIAGIAATIYRGWLMSRPPAN